MQPPFEKPVLTRFTGSFFRRALTVLALVAAAGFGCANLRAQEAVRYSLSQQPTITGYRPTREQGFINIGPFRGHLEADVGVSYTDNANLVNTGAQSQVLFTQTLDLNLRWILTYLNEIDVRLGGTLTEAVGGPGPSIYVALLPTSSIDFKVVSGDFLIQFFDYLSVVQNPTQDPAATNQTTLNRLTNDVGTSVTWDLGKVFLQGRFDWSYSADLGSTGSTGSTTSGAAVRSTLRPGFAVYTALSPEVTTGLDLGYSKSFGAGANDVNAFNAGPFLRGRVTRYINVEVAGGVYVIDGPNLDPLNYYFSVSIAHQLTRWLQYIASVSHDLDFSSGTDVSENTNLTLGTRWQLSRNVSLETDGFINFGRVLTGAQPGDYTQYGVTLQLAWALSKKVTASAGYQFTSRSGQGSTNQLNGVSSGSYRQNQVGLSLRYAF
ncbi:MAG: hypothetical protein JO069_11990 [Verrucomicrobia bacterium]|nr:hypothetical protein [Verrucomicrobiota bacterium]